MLRRYGEQALRDVSKASYITLLSLHRNFTGYP